MTDAYTTSLFLYSYRQYFSSTHWTDDVHILWKLVLADSFHVDRHQTVSSSSGSSGRHMKRGRSVGCSHALCVCMTLGPSIFVQTNTKCGS